MRFSAPAIARRFRMLPTLGGLAAMLAACGPAAIPSGFNDRDEAKNREVHAFNRAVDRAILRPTANTYTTILPEPVERGVSNFATNLDAPGDVLNNLMQARLGRAAENTLRFAINTTIGIGGLFDPATALGVAGDPTDFGETLHVWGVGEGPFLEIPFTGPTTLRDATGTVVDLLANPVANALPSREAFAANLVKLVSRVRDRDRFAATIESILYESADSYAQSRLIYLQARRFQLGQLSRIGESAPADPDSDFIDPYEDPYAE